MGRITIQQLVINSSNFKRLKVDRIKQINDNNIMLAEKTIENRIITNKITRDTKTTYSNIKFS